MGRSAKPRKEEGAQGCLGFRCRVQGLGLVLGFRVSGLVVRKFRA